MAVIAVAEMFGISGRREELTGLLERFERWAVGEPGCRRYVFAAALADPSRYVLFSVWESQEALDAHYRSDAFADFQLSLDGCSHDRASRPSTRSRAPSDQRTPARWIRATPTRPAQGHRAERHGRDEPAGISAAKRITGETLALPRTRGMGGQPCR